MNKSYIRILLGILIIIIAIILYLSFTPEYPCTESGVGCMTWGEVIADTWTTYVLIIGLIYGLWNIYKGV